MSGPYFIEFKARRVAGLPAIWPNTTWSVMQSPPGETWQQAYELGLKLKSMGALKVRIHRPVAR